MLTRYAQAGAYADCYATTVARPVTQAEYIEAFYTGRLFKLERLLLKLFLSKPSTDAQARQLAHGELSDFAAWRVEDQSAEQLLLCDIGGRTRSWLMASPDSSAGTRLYFGSAVVPRVDGQTGRRRMGFLFAALLGFHKLYSRALLGAARSRLAAAGVRPGTSGS